MLDLISGIVYCKIMVNKGETEMTFLPRTSLHTLVGKKIHKVEFLEHPTRPPVIAFIGARNKLLFTVHPDKMFDADGNFFLETVE